MECTCDALTTSLELPQLSFLPQRLSCVAQPSSLPRCPPTSSHSFLRPPPLPSMAFQTCATRFSCFSRSASSWLETHRRHNDLHGQTSIYCLAHAPHRGTYFFSSSRFSPSPGFPSVPARHRASTQTTSYARYRKSVLFLWFCLSSCVK